MTIARAPATILLADDHFVVRAGLRRVLEEEGFTVVAEAGDGLAAVELAERHRPSLVLMDVTMPTLGGIEATRRLLRSWPEAKVVLLSAYGEVSLRLEAVSAGAVAYLLKDCGRDELLGTVVTVLAGRPSVDARGEPAAMDGGRWPRPALTPRQAQVIEAAARGLRSPEIAQSLGISERTVDHHFAGAFRRLGVSRRLDAVLAASREGLIDIGPSLPDRPAD